MDETVIKLPAASPEEQKIRTLNNTIDDQWRFINIRIKRLERNIKIVAGSAAALCLLTGYVAIKKSKTPQPTVPDHSDAVRFQRELFLKLMEEHDPVMLKAKLSVLNSIRGFNSQHSYSSSSYNSSEPGQQSGGQP